MAKRPPSTGRPPKARPATLPPGFETPPHVDNHRHAAVSEEDLALFDRVLSDVKPLYGERGVALDDLDAFERAMNPEPEPEPAAEGTGSGPGGGADPASASTTDGAGALPPAGASGRAKRAGPAALDAHARGRVPGLDRGTATRLRQGRMEIEGRIDLHGMRRLAARQAVSGFLTTSRAAGRRCVLVITGKGVRDDGTTPMGEEPPGVIRRGFREWIKEPPLADAVLAVTPAQPKDGGSGAFYVLLKRRR